MLQPRKIDNKGRVTLGPEYAGLFVLVEEKEDGDIIIHPAAIVPQGEAWLHRNQTAAASVARGLEQAAKGQFAKNPIDLNDDAWLDD